MSVPTKTDETETKPLYPPGPSSDTGGVVPIPIEGRFFNVRQRLAGGYTDEDRAWRKQWLEDQILHPDEPVTPPNYEKEAFNIFRRWGKIPLNILMSPLKPVVGKYYEPTRFYAGRGCMFIFGIYWFWYYAKYCSATWESRSGWKTYYNEGAVFPGHPEYPKVSKKIKPSDFYIKLPDDCPI